MILQRSNLRDTAGTSKPENTNDDHPTRTDHSEPPLTCMFYFFTSQMKRNIQAADPDLVKGGKMPDQPTHRFETLLSRMGMHASFSPLILKVETYPVEIPESMGFSRKDSRASRESVHDTVLLMKFRSKRAREEWIATREWQEFMRNTEAEEVFRRMPHVRCASSVRGLMDPMDILTS